MICVLHQRTQEFKMPLNRCKDTLVCFGVCISREQDLHGIIGNSPVGI